MLAHIFWVAAALPVLCSAFLVAVRSYHANRMTRAKRVINKLTERKHA